MTRKNGQPWKTKLTLSVISVVSILIVAFFMLTSNSIGSLLKSDMAQRSQHCAHMLDNWTASVLEELRIYKKAIEDNFNDDPVALEQFLKTTYEVHDAYPMGIYLGDDTGLYLDASGWVPDYSEWVLVERPWYLNGKDSEDFVFGEPYLDAMLHKLCISASARVDYDAAVRVMTTDVYLDYAQKLVNDIAVNQNIEGGLFVTQNDHTIIADSASDTAGHPLAEQNDFYQQLDALLQGETRQTELIFNHTVYLVNVTQTESTGWYLITYVRKSNILSFLYQVEGLMALIAIAGSLTLTLVTLRYARQMDAMQYKARTDKLTKVLNREGFEEVVGAMLGEHPAQGVLLIFDLDNFKLVNDNLGHPEGDRVLIDYADLLESYFNRKNDIVARIGGDEFVVFIGRQMTRENLETMLKHFMERMQTHFKKEYSAFGFSASIGAAFAEVNLSYGELYRQADAALYHAKREGKHAFQLYDETVLDDPS